MSWTPTAEYWAKKLSNIMAAIKGTERALETLTEQRQIEAHQAQIASYEKEYAKTWQRYRSWQNKRQNVERGARI